MLENLINRSVTKNQVRYKRSKYSISIRHKIIDDFISCDNELFIDLSNGPVEDMHSSGQLSEEDMKVLNKYMVNRLAGILLAVYENKWLQLELLQGHCLNR